MKQGELVIMGTKDFFQTIRETLSERKSSSLAMLLQRQLVTATEDLVSILLDTHGREDREKVLSAIRILRQQTYTLCAQEIEKCTSLVHLYSGETWQSLGCDTWTSLPVELKHNSEIQQLMCGFCAIIDLTKGLGERSKFQDGIGNMRKSLSQMESDLAVSLL